MGICSCTKDSKQATSAHAEEPMSHIEVAIRSAIDTQPEDSDESDHEAVATSNGLVMEPEEVKQVPLSADESKNLLKKVERAQSQLGTDQTEVARPTTPPKKIDDSIYQIFQRGDYSM